MRPRQHHPSGVNGRTCTPADVHYPPRVALFGDSLSWEAQSDPNRDALNRRYAEIAAADPAHVTYIDAGTALEGPNHTWVQTLPCLAVEPCIGPVIDGVPPTMCGLPDGAHFCPVESGYQNGVINGCPIYSSGAVRSADAMVEPLARPA